MTRPADLPGAAVYLGLAYGGAWLVCLPLWVSRQGLSFSSPPSC